MLVFRCVLFPYSFSFTNIKTQHWASVSSHSSQLRISCLPAPPPATGLVAPPRSPWATRINRHGSLPLLVTGASGLNTFLGFFQSLCNHSLTCLHLPFLPFLSTSLKSATCSVPSSFREVSFHKKKKIPVLDLQSSVYLCFLSGVPEKGEGIERNLLDITNAAVYFFVVSWKRKYNVLILYLPYRRTEAYTICEARTYVDDPLLHSRLARMPVIPKAELHFWSLVIFKHSHDHRLQEETNGFRKRIRYKAKLKGIR